MNLIDKAYVLITPKKPFWEYVSLYNKSLDDAIQFHSPTLYLIDEDNWDEDQWLKGMYQKIAIAESSLFIESEKNFLILENDEQFHKYFSFQIGDVVFDSDAKS